MAHGDGEVCHKAIGLGGFGRESLHCVQLPVKPKSFIDAKADRSWRSTAHPAPVPEIQPKAPILILNTDAKMVHIINWSNFRSDGDPAKHLTHTSDTDIDNSVALLVDCVNKHQIIKDRFGQSDIRSYLIQASTNLLQALSLLTVFPTTTLWSQRTARRIHPALGELSTGTPEAQSHPWKTSHHTLFFS